MNERTRSTATDARETIITVLRSRSKKARFITEVAAVLRGVHIDAGEMERVLAELEAEGVVMIRDHFCADPHLAGVDLRVVALVESIDGADAQLRAIREIDSTWNQWLGEYLANHRCG